MTERLLGDLRRRANHRSVTLVRPAVLQESLACSFQELLSALAHLAEAGKIEILSPAPYLTIALLPRKWPGGSLPRVQKLQQISNESAGMYKEVPVSSAAAAAMQQREVGGAGEGGTLLDEVLAALGPEADRAEFAAILQGRPPELIERALRRVRNTRHIRVSKAALFRSLLEKFSQ